jgi:hypothetical protein
MVDSARAIAANEMKEQGYEATLDKFWPLVDSQAVINRHSPSKKGKEKEQEEDIQVEEPEQWQTRSPWKASEDASNARMAALEKTQESTTSIVASLSNELSKTRVECSEVLIKAKEAIEGSKRAVNALVKHLKALDEEIEAYAKIVENNEHAASYLGAQVKNISEHITKLTNRTREPNESHAENPSRYREEDERTGKRSQSQQRRTEGSAHEETEGGERVRTSPS